MTDDGTKSPLDDFDWDAALSEWDKKPFEPDLAKEKKEKEEEGKSPKPAAAKPPPPVPPGAKQPALYRPPQETLDPTASHLLEQARVSPPKPIAKPPAIPRKRGGLGQLFGRGESSAPARPAPSSDDEALDVLFDEPGPRRTSGSDEDDEAVVTSAIDVGAEGAPRQSVRPQLATLDVEPHVPDGALFDPFQDPAPEPVKNDQPTRFPPPPPPDDDSDAATSVADLSSLRAKIEAAREQAAPPPPPPAAGRPAMPPRPAAPPPPAPSAPAIEELPPARERIASEEAELVRSDELLSAPALADEDAELAALLDAPIEAAADIAHESVREPEVVAPAPAAGPSELRGAVVFEDEKPANDWLPDEARPSFEARATMFEEEAQNMLDKSGRARCLLAASELRAILGQRDEAERLAGEALEANPSLAFAHRQARAFVPFEADTLVPRLDAEAKLALPPLAKLHDALLAADLIARTGDDEATSKRLEQAARFAPNDARVVVQRAARGLAQDGPPSATLRVPDAPHLTEVAHAVSTLLGLRGVDRKEGGSSPEGALRRARVALERNDTTAACAQLQELGATPALQPGAHWLAAALAATKSSTRAQAVTLLQGLAATDPRAQRALAARALELGDVESLRAAAGGEGFDEEERAVLSALAGAKPALGDDVAPALRAALVDPSAALDVRLDAIQGDDATKAALRVGRGMAAGKLDPTRLDALDAHDPSFVRAARIEEAAAAGRIEEVSAALASWSDTSQASLAAGIVAERAGLAPRAAAAYGSALAADPTNEAAARAAAATDPELPLAVALERVAEACGDPLRAAVLRLEIILRSGDLAARREDLVALAKAAPQLPIANFLAEREARRAADVDAVVELVRERSALASDPIEKAVDQVREAFLVADTDATLAAGLLEEALRARPDDVAVRELLERISPTPPTDRAEWRASRAAAATGSAKSLLLLEAAWDYERQEQPEAALAAIRQIGEPTTMAPLARVALERVEVAAGDAARLADELLTEARSAGSVRARSEAYERLAELDRHARNDPASALLWHRTILEETPDHAASLRHVEHALMDGRRDDELEPILAAIATYLKGTGGEALSHAEIAARFRMNGNQWDATLPLAELAVAEKVPSLWALRLRNAHARAKDDDEALLATTKSLIERCTRPGELATLLLRATEAATRLGRPDEAKAYILRATTEDAADTRAWRLLSEVHLAAGEHGPAAEALESVARTATVEEHRVDAYYGAAIAWTEAGDEERAVAALEQVASANVTYKDVFPRLSRLYAKRGARTELASLLERRIGTVLDPEERVDLEVDRGRVLAEIGDPGAAKEAYEAALAIKPDHVGALGAAADLAFQEKDWEGAEQAWVRLVRLLPQPEEQLAIYRRLGALYAEQLANYSRAEVAFQEVLKRAPDEIQVREQLVDVYKRQNDPARALEAQQDLIKRAPDSKTKQKRLVELAAIYEYVSHDLRKAEQTLEAARREFPSDVAALRALAEYYVRQKQAPAVNILLDRAAGDARRALAAGRINAALFETMQTVYELRNKEDAGKVVRASLAALKNETPSRDQLMRGGEARALDPRLDDLLAPELLTAAARALLTRTGSALDAAVPLDPRTLRANPYPPTEPAARLAIGLAQAAGVPNLQLFVSPQLGRACVPGASPSPILVLGEELVNEPREVARAFLITRGVKLLQLHGSAFARLPPGDLPVLVGAWLKAFVPNWSPQGIAPGPLAEAGRRLAAGMPRQLDPDLGAMALEVIGGVGPQIAALGAAVLSIANRTALLAVGEPSAALDALAWASGPKVSGAPATEQERVSFLSRNAEVKDVFAFTLADAYMDARGRLGVR